MKQYVKRWRVRLVLASMASVLLCLGLGDVKQVGAAGTASFSISPASGAYTVGSTINVAISETSSPSDNTNAVQVNLTFPTSLAWQSTSLTGPFTLCAQNSHTATTVSLACAATSAQSGTQAIATVSFKVMSAGSAAVAMAAGSDIANTAGSSVFNGSLPSATYTLASGTAPPPQSSTPAKSKAAATTTPATSTAPPPDPTPAAEAPSTGSLSVTVKDSAGKHLEGALVKLDEQVIKTSASGVANFSGVSSGDHMLEITASGKQLFRTTITIKPGENKMETYTLADAKSTSPSRIWLIVTVVGLLLGAGGLILYLKFRRGH